MLAHLAINPQGRILSTGPCWLQADGPTNEDDAAISMSQLPLADRLSRRANIACTSTLHDAFEGQQQGASSLPCPNEQQLQMAMTLSGQPNKSVLHNCCEAFDDDVTLGSRLEAKLRVGPIHLTSD